MMVQRHFKILLGTLVIGVMISFAMVTRPVLAEEPLELKVATFTAQSITWTKGIARIFDLIEERSNGRIKFKWYYSGTLVPPRETLGALKAGVADIAVTGSTLHPGKTPLATVTSLPLIQKWFYMTAMAGQELFLDVPETRDELAQYNVMYLSHAQNSSYGLWSSFPIHSIADIKGKKIQATGALAKLVEALGGVTVTVVPTEIYTVLQRGTADGAMGNPTYGAGYKWNEVCKYYYKFPFGSVMAFTAINKDSWNKIPPDIQKMFRDYSDEAVRYAYEVYTEQGRKVLAEGQASGKMVITEPSAEDEAYVKKVAEEVVFKDWVDNMNQKGLPGQKVLDTYVKILAKWEARDPFKE